MNLPVIYREKLHKRFPFNFTLNKELIDLLKYITEDIDPCAKHKNSTSIDF